MSQNLIHQLSEEIEIPMVMQEKVQEAFVRIRAEQEKNEKKGERRRPYRFAASVAVGVLVFGAVTAGAAAYVKWSKGLEKQLQVREEQKECFEESGLVDFMEQTVTDKGITITAQQSIVDNYYAYISFKVEGYEMEDGIQPGFETVDIKIDGNQDILSAYSHGFYDGLLMDETGRVVRADGKEIPVNEAGEPIFSYQLADGSMEYHILMETGGDTEPGYFLGKEIEVKFAGFGKLGEEERLSDVVNGRWSFNWTMQGTDETFTASCDTPLGESNATIKQVDISPISIRVVSDCPRKDAESAVSPDEINDVPPLMGVKLRDGTIYGNLLSMGSNGYKEDSDEYQMLFATNRILNVDEVESVLFLKNAKNEGEIRTKEDYYEVKIR